MLIIAVLSWVIKLALVNAQAAPPTSLLNIPANLAVSDSQFLTGATFDLALSRQPLGDVLVMFDSPDTLRLDRCQVTFTRDSWSISQKIAVYPISKTNADGVRVLSLTAKAYEIASASALNGTDTAGMCKLYTQTIQIQRTILPAKLCSSVGDPHITTFDGLYYIMAGSEVGIQTLYATNDKATSVQMGNYACNPGVVCTHKIAIRHYDSFFTMFFDSSKKDPNDPGLTVQFVAGAHNHMVYSRRMAPDPEGNQQITIDVTLDDGTFITMQVIWWIGPNTWFMNTQITAPGIFANLVNGVCGDFNGDQGNDAYNSAAVTIAAGSDSDLFTCGVNCTTFASVSRDERTQCMIPPNYVPTLCNPPPPPPPPPAPTPTAVVLAAQAIATPTPTPEPVAAPAVNVSVAVNISIPVQSTVSVFVGVNINIDTRKNEENNTAYCMRVASQYSTNATQDMIAGFCNFDAKFSTNIHVTVTSFVGQLQVRAKEELNLMVSPMGGNSSLAQSPQAVVLAQTFNLQPTQQPVVKYFNPVTGGSYPTVHAANAATQRFHQRPPVIPAIGSKCNVKQVCVC